MQKGSVVYVGCGILFFLNTFAASSPAESVLSMFLNFVISFFFLKLFKLPLEKEGQVGGPILAQEEIKTIFGSIPDIYEVHTRIKVLSGRVQCYPGSAFSSLHCFGFF